MKTKIMTPAMVNVQKMIGKAGELQQKAHALNKQYDKQRSDLIGPLKELFGTEHYVSSTDGKFCAILSYDECTKVDVLELLKLYKKGKIEDDIIKQILSVNIGVARKVLPGRIEKKVLESSKKDKPVLHISKVSSV